MSHWPSGRGSKCLNQNLWGWCNKSVLGILVVYFSLWDHRKVLRYCSKEKKTLQSIQKNSICSKILEHSVHILWVPVMAYKWNFLFQCLEICELKTVLSLFKGRCWCCLCWRGFGWGGDEDLPAAESRQVRRTYWCGYCYWRRYCSGQTWESEQSLLLSFGTVLCSGSEIPQEFQMHIWSISKSVHGAGSRKPFCQGSKTEKWPLFIVDKISQGCS